MFFNRNVRRQIKQGRMHTNIHMVFARCSPQMGPDLEGFRALPWLELRSGAIGLRSGGHLSAIGFGLQVLLSRSSSTRSLISLVSEGTDADSTVFAIVL